MDSDNCRTNFVPKLQSGWTVALHGHDDEIFQFFFMNRLLPSHFLRILMLFEFNPVQGVLHYFVLLLNGVNRCLLCRLCCAAVASEMVKKV